MKELEKISAQLIRDLCSCRDCRDEISGQRMRSVMDLSPELLVLDVAATSSGFRFTLNDKHEVELQRDTIEEILEGFSDINWRSEASKVLWDRDHAPRTVFHWSDIQEDSHDLYQLLDQLLVYGFALVENLPVRDRAVIDLIHRFGYERVTNYGDIFDVRVENNPNNLAFTNLAIAPHTDNPYRDPVPTIQALHCLESSVTGGNSGLVDGFRAAHLLREENPDAFDILSNSLFNFEYRNPTTYLSASAPIIKVDVTGEIIEVRWNDRSMQAPISEIQVDIVYDALRSFAILVNDARNCHTFKLNPGDCVIFDNTRTLHARTAFDSGGKRHLQGAYADLDSAISKHAILEEMLEA
ncbi:MAG: gamma-butyrobetaine hydroxylase [Actinobacteria bacterium]|nr:gamma-butyrobetaine hydroxylase [Actinomycetota bacterium]NBP22690.1 gamma-butyrobetaine hydroxylase [Actinomycetota bacterium]NBP42872.1 gamma-butyrobetaine hydroxylase [Actinomycetota bacterium]NBQ00830.1 gamma-butyrobetaine hydroxylase [Actinomycetota bacterium]NBQ66493.1 gamma-butyrobetaine hydroxylase [Actinomycetota bacterium]